MACARPRAGCDGRDGTECLVCPYQFACPSCHAAPGHLCRRPSGHDCHIHEPRVLLADATALREHREAVERNLTADEIERWERKLHMGA